MTNSSRLQEGHDVASTFQKSNSRQLNQSCLHSASFNKMALDLSSSLVSTVVARSPAVRGTTLMRRSATSSGCNQFK
jgi:hypothetical protein